MKLINHTTICFTIMAIVLTISCSSQKASVSTTTPANSEYQEKTLTNNSMYLPHAVIYKTNGDYNDNVPVTLNAEGNALVSYPAPTDLTPNSTPLLLKRGWLLDRRGGIGQNTAFLKYTYDSYRKLDKVPSIKQLLDSIIPNAKVTQCRVLPITLNQALNDPSLIEKYLSD